MNNNNDGEEENLNTDGEETDIVDDYTNSPDGQLKDAMQEENASDSDFDYQQGFNSGGNYPEAPIKDSILKFYRGIISLMKPKQVVRVANFTFKESKNSKIYLNYADYNFREGNELIAEALRDMAVVESAVSMGKKGFIVTNIMTQRRIVSRQTEKSGGQQVSGWNKPGGQKQ